MWCRPFSADANGSAKGDDLGLLLLKRLSDAERDCGHDGNEEKINFVVPSAAGQGRLLANIYSQNNFDTRKILFVEAHSRGTPVGDPIEANCLDRFFNRSNLDPPLLLCSIKSNLEHTEGAAGIASLIRVAMCMYYRSITANMQFTSLNPKIEAQKYNLYILQNSVPFPTLLNNEKVAIGVNSFDMGGTTTHAIIEEYQLNKTSIENDYIDHENHIQSKQEYPQLYESEPLFNKWISLIDGEMTKINNGEWRLLEELIEKKNEQESRINDTNIAQPTLNIYPSSIISHSAGDQAAAFVADRLSLEETVRMLAVSMSEEEVENKLLKDIEHLACIAVVDSPRSVTISGDETQQILSISYPNIFKACVRIENAFHYIK
ncbi:unnamed protein product [Adineta steineri]|uniref:Ketosynthase family 3 (KS3) domain-containing protein n=1 Tax=Adineta steineri TaxID=433720 RepID=A0A815J5T1_9BILA|nr:unnamed protein product [Adineta steineri]CAF1374865.1 unnamed protein product [Adineta steineri]